FELSERLGSRRSGQRVTPSRGVPFHVGLGTTTLPALTASFATDVTMVLFLVLGRGYRSRETFSPIGSGKMGRTRDLWSERRNVVVDHDCDDERYEHQDNSRCGGNGRP